jgi:uncharacterized protein (DUF362 family)
MSLVGFAKIRENTIDSAEQAISESLNLIHYKFDKKINDVVIKPNLCYYWDYSTGQTTDPKFIAALVNLIRRKVFPRVNISIVESDASAMKCRHAFRILGYEKLARDYNVRLVNLSQDSFENVQASLGTQSFQIRVPRTVKEADLKINVPKIKYTGRKEIKLTCALKNIFGCNPYPEKFKYHSRLGEAIVAINKAMKFDLCIIDGNVVSGIQSRKLGLAMASQDPVAIDVAAAEIAGINPKTLRYIQLASKEGLGSKHFIPKGSPIAHFKKAYPRKNIKGKLMDKAYSLTKLIGLGKRLGIE